MTFLRTIRYMCCDRVLGTKASSVDQAVFRVSASSRISRSAQLLTADHPVRFHSKRKADGMTDIQKNFDERAQSGSSEANSHEWGGRFPRNEIISLLDVNRPFNLAESTSQDLTVGELLDLPGLERIRDLKLGYGTSAGGIALREAISDRS